MSLADFRRRVADAYADVRRDGAGPASWRAWRASRDALFAGHDFAAHNPVSRVMQAMSDALDGHGLEAETKRLDKFYNSVRLRAEQVVSAEGKQHLILLFAGIGVATFLLIRCFDIKWLRAEEEIVALEERLR
jgi:hypothetical protein